jgi:hypothetical protein
MSTPMRRTRFGCCPRAERTRDRGAAEQRDELAPSYVETNKPAT